MGTWAMGQRGGHDIGRSEEGRLFTDKIPKRDAEFGKAIGEGLRWQRCARARFPGAPSVLQGSGHVSATCHCCCTAGQGEPPHWVPIRRAVLRTRLPFRDRLDELVAFVAGKSGGERGSSSPTWRFATSCSKTHPSALAARQCCTQLWRTSACSTWPWPRG